MGIYRLFTGADGESHIEALSLERSPELTSPRPVAEISFFASPPGEFLDWHPAPRRQWIIILEGTLEIGLGDGTTHRFGPGDARLVEDTTGRGHTTRTISDKPCLMAVVPLTSEGA